MQFIVITAEGTETYNGSYEVEDSGVLKIRPKDRSELISLSPAFWRQINEPRSSYDMLDSATTPRGRRLCVSVADSNLPIALDCASERQSRSLEVARAVVELRSATPRSIDQPIPGHPAMPFR